MRGEGRGVVEGEGGTWLVGGAGDQTAWSTRGRVAEATWPIRHAAEAHRLSSRAIDLKRSRSASVDCSWLRSAATSPPAASEARSRLSAASARVVASEARVLCGREETREVGVRERELHNRT